MTRSEFNNLFANVQQVLPVIEHILAREDDGGGELVERWFSVCERVGLELPSARAVLDSIEQGKIELTWDETSRWPAYLNREAQRRLGRKPYRATDDETRYSCLKCRDSGRVDIWNLEFLCNMNRFLPATKVGFEEVPVLRKQILEVQEATGQTPPELEAKLGALLAEATKRMQQLWKTWKKLMRDDGRTPGFWGIHGIVACNCDAGSNLHALWLESGNPPTRAILREEDVPYDRGYPWEVPDNVRKEAMRCTALSGGPGGPESRF